MKTTPGPWQTLGRVGLDNDGRLVLPSPPRAPGLYRFRLRGDAPSVYVGETDQLPRRFTHYRNPEQSQRTNVRLNDRMHEHIAAGGTVDVDVCTEAWIEVGSEREVLDLSRKSHRMLAEEAALEEARTGGLGRVENVGG